MGVLEGDAFDFSQDLAHCGSILETYDSARMWSLAHAAVGFGLGAARAC